MVGACDEPGEHAELLAGFCVRQLPTQRGGGRVELGATRLVEQEGFGASQWQGDLHGGSVPSRTIKVPSYRG